MSSPDEYVNSYDVEFDKANSKKAQLIIFNVITFLASLSIFGLCIWIRFDLDFREWVYEIDWFAYWYCMYVILLGMVLVLATSGGQIVAIMYDSVGTLTLCQILFVCCMLFELTGCVVILVYGVEESHVLTEQLKDVFKTLIYRINYDPRAMRILRIIQEYVGCCGANGSEDYSDAMKPVPWECRDPVKGGEYPYGCAQQLAWWLEPWSATMAAFCLILLVIHVIQIVFTSQLKTSLRALLQSEEYHYPEEDNRYGEDDRRYQSEKYLKNGNYRYQSDSDAYND